MISAEILADSKNQFGDRLTTFKVTFPRIILAELNTHRMFSRNSASSRAIPFEKMVESVEKNPFIPIAWQKDHKGMQGMEYHHDSNILEDIWLEARDKAIKAATSLNTGVYKNNMVFKGESDYGHRVTKQLCNRLLEPFMYHTVILTSSAEGLENFFNLRCPQYHSPVDTYFRHKSRKDCVAAHSNPENIALMNSFTDIDWLKINEGQSEIHMSDNINYGDLSKVAAKLDTSNGKVYNLPVMISVARCARVSYTTFGEDKVDNYEADIKLYDRLLQSGHASPMEHVALCKNDSNWYANFKGWQSLRNILKI